MCHFSFFSTLGCSSYFLIISPKLSFCLIVVLLQDSAELLFKKHVLNISAISLSLLVTVSFSFSCKIIFVSFFLFFREKRFDNLPEFSAISNSSDIDIVIIPSIRLFLRG